MSNNTRVRRVVKSWRCLAALLWLVLVPGAVLADSGNQATPFVVQLTRGDENNGHRRVFLQLDKVLDEIGDSKLKFVVVAYEEGIQALTADNRATNQWLTKLANRGVVFKACRISMRAWDLDEGDFPLEVEFVPAGAPEVIRLQMTGYKYWRP